MLSFLNVLNSCDFFPLCMFFSFLRNLLQSLLKSLLYCFFMYLKQRKYPFLNMLGSQEMSLVNQRKINSLLFYQHYQAPVTREESVIKVSARPTLRLFFFGLVLSSQISRDKTVHQQKPNLPLLLSYFLFLSHGFCHLWIKMC